MAKPPPERKNRKAEIVRCFGELVAEHGYDNVSLRDVAEQLDMSKGTILHHFGSKDRLLERVHADYMERRLAEAHTLLARLESAPQRLAGLIYQLMCAEHDDHSATVAFAREIMRFASDEVMSDVREHLQTPIEPDAVDRARQRLGHRSRQCLTEAGTSRAVRIQGSPAVTATVCSKCADRLLSRVTAVQPSASTLTAALPAFTIGSIASTMPSLSRGPRPGSP